MVRRENLRRVSPPYTFETRSVRLFYCHMNRGNLPGNSVLKVCVENDRLSVPQRNRNLPPTQFFFGAFIPLPPPHDDVGCGPDSLNTVAVAQ
jgi:hypothetical protein